MASLVSNENTPTAITCGNPNGAVYRASAAQNDEEPVQRDEALKVEQLEDSVFKIKIKIPHTPYEIEVMVSTQEQVQDVRNSIIELPHTYQYTCFHLEHNEERINDFSELSEVKGLGQGSEIRLVEDPYTEKEARMHVMRIRDLIGAVGKRADVLHGVSAGLSLHDYVLPPKIAGLAAPNGASTALKLPETLHAMADYNFDAPASTDTILRTALDTSPKTIKSLSVSPWNPPPCQLRQKGHLLYLQITTLEGEQFQITSHISGFFVNKSSNSKFDPFPRPEPKSAAAHSLLILLAKLSPSFEASFDSLQQHNNLKDPVTNCPMISSLPSNPWLVPVADTFLGAHLPDLTRTQEAYLMSGVESSENLRDWNEEFQSTRELPRDNIQDRLFRDRISSKLFADFTDAAARGAVMVARGEIQPLNPTESNDAQIFVYNNIFFSYGADGVGTFTSEGGNEAARVAVSKDVAGVKAVNQIDVKGLSTPGTVVADYLGKRIVGQSIVPGIFKQREPTENQIDYGAVEGRDVVAENQAFVPTFSKLSRALNIKRHDVWDKEGKKHTLEASVETKGLLGTDGRKYILDLYRLTPLDVLWLDDYWSEGLNYREKSCEKNYPHRMAVLRLELIHNYVVHLELSERTAAEVKRRKFMTNGNTKIGEDPQIASVVSEDRVGSSTEEAVLEKRDKGDPEDLNHGVNSLVSIDEQEHVDLQKLGLAFNPDVFCGQLPRSEEDKLQLADDEKDVRAIGTYLYETVIPEFVRELEDGDVGFPMDGQSLARLLHKRGINMRYLGRLARMTKGKSPRLEALHRLVVQEMIARSFKHVAAEYLRDLPAVFATSCLAHLLNCVLGSGLNSLPKAQYDEDLQSFYPNVDWSFIGLEPHTLIDQISQQVYARFRYSLDEDWNSNIKHIQLLRDICQILGLQLAAKNYHFVSASSNSAIEHRDAIADSILSNGRGSNGKKARKNGDQGFAMISSESVIRSASVTFAPDDIVNIFPIVKDACPISSIAEETMQAGKMSMLRGDREVGQDLLLETMSLHEQIYGVVHPEVAGLYHQLAMLYHQLGEKSGAVELAHKSVIIFERTLGLDASETVLGYLNVGLFEHANGNTKVALVYVRHALQLWKLIYGLNHPDSITTINNIAVMLQTLKQYKDSRIWFEHSLVVCERVSGKDSVNAATLGFQLAQALALDQDAKGAVKRMREAYSIFLAKLGPDDRNTKESESWLEQLTQNAVSIAKHAKDVQARRLRRIQLSGRVPPGIQPQPQVKLLPADILGGTNARHATAADPRSVDELMSYIEGSGGSSKIVSTKKRSTRNNPKRRGASRILNASG